MDGRQERGRGIAAQTQIVRRGAEWMVPSQSVPHKRYVVNPFSQHCTCPDHELTRYKCKHLFAVEYLLTEVTTTQPDGTETVTRTARLTYSQDWSAYNAAQVVEKDRFMQLLADLCRNVPNPVQTKGRPRLPLGEMAFAATFKVFSRFSSRRFSSDLREANERGLIAHVPHFNSVSNYLSSPNLTPVLQRLITTSALPLKAVESQFAVDSSGFSTNRFAQWVDFKYGKAVQAKSRDWIKAHVMCGTFTNVVTSVEITRWNEGDTRQFPALLARTAEHFDVVEVSADKAYLSRKNVALVDQVGAEAFIPFKINSIPAIDDDSAWGRMWHLFSLNRDEFLAHYHRRSNVETTFSMIKAKFGDSVLSKSRVGQVNEVLCKVLAHNVVVVGQAIQELGISP